MTNPISCIKNPNDSLPTSELVQEQKPHNKKQGGKNPKLWIHEIMKKIFLWWGKIPPNGLIVHRVLSLLLSWVFVLALCFVFPDTASFNPLSLYLAMFVTSFLYGISLSFMGMNRLKTLFGENLFRYLCLILIACYTILLFAGKIDQANLIGLEAILVFAAFLLGIIDGFTFFHPQMQKEAGYLEGLGALCAAIVFGFMASFQMIKPIGIFITATWV